MPPEWNQKVCEMCINTVKACITHLEDEEYDEAQYSLSLLYKHITEWQKSWEKEYERVYSSLRGQVGQGTCNEDGL